MSCDQIQEKMNAYLDNELSPSEKETVSTHISSCESCRKNLVKKNQLAKLVQDSTIPDPPLNLTAQILAKARTRHSKPSIFFQAFSALSNWWFLETPAMHGFAVVSILVTLSFGSFVGWGLSFNRESSPVNPTNQTTLLFSTFNLDVLSDVPEGSLPHVYLTLSPTSAKTGK